jgi:hypothetical protein
MKKLILVILLTLPISIQAKSGERMCPGDCRYNPSVSIYRVITHGFAIRFHQWGLLHW